MVRKLVAILVGILGCSLSITAYLELYSLDWISVALALLGLFGASLTGYWATRIDNRALTVVSLLPPVLVSLTFCALNSELVTVWGDMKGVDRFYDMASPYHTGQIFVSLFSLFYLFGHMMACRRCSLPS